MKLKYIQWLAPAALCLAVGTVAAKPVTPNYGNKSGNLARDATKSIVEVSARGPVENIAADVVESAVTVGAWDMGFPRAAVYGGAAKATFQAKDLPEQYLLLYEAGKDYWNKGFEGGAEDAYNKLYQSDSARPWLKIGEFYGDTAASFVNTYKQGVQLLAPKDDPRLRDFDLSGLKRAEGCNACKCKHETANLKPQIWQNGLDDGYSIVVLCAECKAVKYSEAKHDKKSEAHKICTCASPDVFFAGICRKKVGVVDKLWTQYYCRKCGGFCSGDMFDIVKTDNGFATYPAGVIPSSWDGKVYEQQSELDAHVRRLVSEPSLGSSERSCNRSRSSHPSVVHDEGHGGKSSVSVKDKKQISDTSREGEVEKKPLSDSQIGVRGWCKCKHSDSHAVGMPPMGRYMYSICRKCGKVQKGEDGYQGMMIVDFSVSANGSDQEKLKAAQAKLFAIPDGQVVIPGKCVCPEAKGASEIVQAGDILVHATCGKIITKWK